MVITLCSTCLTVCGPRAGPQSRATHYPPEPHTGPTRDILSLPPPAIAKTQLHWQNIFFSQHFRSFTFYPSSSNPTLRQIRRKMYMIQIYHCGGVLYKKINIFISFVLYFYFLGKQHHISLCVHCESQRLSHEEIRMVPDPS